MRIIFFFIVVLLLGCTKNEPSTKSSEYDMALEISQINHFHLDTMHWINKSFTMLGYDKSFQDTLPGIQSLQGQVFSALKKIQGLGEKNEALVHTLDTITDFIERDRIVRQYRMKFPDTRGNGDFSDKKATYTQYLLKCDAFFIRLNYMFMVSMMDMMSSKFPPPPL